MTGNEILNEVDMLLANDMFPVMTGSTAMKLIHVNNAVTKIHERVKFKAVAQINHAGLNPNVVPLTNLIPNMCEVTSVRSGNECLPHLSGWEPNGYGWYGTNRDSITILGITTTLTLTIEGYMKPMPIQATDAQITDLHNRLLVPVIYYAAYLQTGAHEDTNEQQGRRVELERMALNGADQVASEIARSNFKAIF